MIDALPLATLLLGIVLGVGCTWRYWREKLRREYQDKSKWN